MANITKNIQILALVTCFLVQSAGPSYALRPVAEKCILGKGVTAKSEKKALTKNSFILHINESRDAQHAATREEGLDFPKWKEIALNIIHFLRFIIGKNFQYTDFFMSLTAYPSKHILLITDLHENKIGIGDILVFYKPVIQILLKLFPETKITAVTNKIGLLEQHNPRFRILPQNEFLDLYDTNAGQRIANLEAFREKFGVDSVFDMSWKCHKNWQGSLFKVFPGIVVLMYSKYGVIKKIPNQAAYFNTLPYRLSFAFFKNFHSQAEALLKDIGAYEPDPTHSMILNVNAKDRAWLDSVIENSERPLVLLNLFTTENKRDWNSVKEITFFIEKAIKKEKMALIIPRPLNREQDLLINRVMEEIPASMHPYITIIKEKGLHKVKLLIKRSDYIITTDTGIGHLAIALKKEPIVLFNNSLFRLYKGLGLSWLPSLRVRDKKDYVVSFFPGHFNPNKVIKKLILQKIRFTNQDTKDVLLPDNKIPPKTHPGISKLEKSLSTGVKDINAQKIPAHSTQAGAVPLNYLLRINSAA